MNPRNTRKDAKGKRGRLKAELRTRSGSSALPIIAAAVLMVCGAGATDLPTPGSYGAAWVPLRWACIEQNCVGYRVWWGPESRQYTNVEELAWLYATNCAVEVDARTFFAVTAYGPGGESGFSEEVMWEPAPALRLIVDGGNGNAWQPLWTNELRAMAPMEFFRVRIER